MLLGNSGRRCVSVHHAKNSTVCSRFLLSRAFPTTSDVIVNGFLSGPGRATAGQLAPLNARQTGEREFGPLASPNANRCDRLLLLGSRLCKFLRQVRATRTVFSSQS